MAANMFIRQDVRDQYEDLARVISYDPASGTFTWREGYENRGRKKGEAGYLMPCGYRVLSLAGRRTVAHRFAWFVMTGDIPQKCIDHINRNPSDNRWSNLRLATHQQNKYNMTKQKNNTSGYKGVNWHDAAGKWVSRISVEGKRVVIGYFNTKEEAGAAYAFMADLYHGEFACADV